MRGVSWLEGTKRPDETWLEPVEPLSRILVDALDDGFEALDEVCSIVEVTLMAEAGFVFEGGGGLPTEETASRTSNLESSWANLLLVNLRVSELSETSLRGEFLREDECVLMLAAFKDGRGCDIDEDHVLMV